MKKFTLTIFCVTACFLGLGSIFDCVSASFKSDDRALEILRQARQAVGGEDKIKSVKSMTIVGKSAKTSPDNPGSPSQANFELNLSLPNQFSKTFKSVDDKNPDDKNANFESKFDVVVANQETDKKGDFTIQKDDDQATFRGKAADSPTGTVDDNPNPQDNELFRTVLSLLLTPPAGVDVAYTYSGEENIDGAGCDVIEAKAGKNDIKLYLNKSSHLPLMMKFQAPKQFLIKFDRNDMPDQTIRITTPDTTKPEPGEFQVKFSDYRAVDGLQFPFAWTQTVDGKPDESLVISNYEINSANISEKFKNKPVRIFIRRQ